MVATPSRENSKRIAVIENLDGRGLCKEVGDMSVFPVRIRLRTLYARVRYRQGCIRYAENVRFRVARAFIMCIVHGADVARWLMGM